MQVNVPNLRTAFEAAADKTGVPCNPFYTKMREAVFNTCLQALGEYDYTGKPWLHIVSAAPGAGKTTLTNAFIAALVETVPRATCLVVVEQIKSVKTRLADLEKLLPGKVACWTSKFATANKKFAKDGRKALADFPVARQSAASPDNSTWSAASSAAATISLNSSKPIGSVCSSSAYVLL
jgi:superfamily II DNA or RNA helicase